MCCGIGKYNMQKNYIPTRVTTVFKIVQNFCWIFFIYYYYWNKYGVLSWVMYNHNILHLYAQVTQPLNDKGEGRLPVKPAKYKNSRKNKI